MASPMEVPMPMADISAVDIDALVLGKWITEELLGNATVFKIHPASPGDSEFQLPYLPWISEFETMYRWNRVTWPVVAARDAYGVKLGLLVSLVYVVVIFSIQKWMKSRPRYNLRVPLVTWNLALCIFSIIGTMRCWPEFSDVWRRNGVYGTLCNGRLRHTPLEIWGWAFMFSKIAEMVDTIFIVLRKQKLIFLHWFHHVFTFLYTVLFMTFDSNAPGRWFMLMNFAIHSAMYGYYAARASKLVAIPRWVCITITAAQILQMFVGFGISLLTLYIKSSPAFGGADKCQITYANLITANTMYVAYIFLFINFFYHAYINKPQQAATREKAAVVRSGRINNNNNDDNGLVYEKNNNLKFIDCHKGKKNV